MKRAKIFTVTNENKIKGIKDRRNIRPIAEIRERIAYDPMTGAFTYVADCAVGKAGEDAVWRCRRTDCVGTPYENTRHWELVKYDENHWYEPRRLAYYFVRGEWPPVDTWVASGRKYDYSADALQLVATGQLPSPPPIDATSSTGSVTHEVPDESRNHIDALIPAKKGILARLFGLLGIG
jgi:hypothetical protein